jgi:phosphatidylserine/phosphatidylglycerophosphate/cardiolipin synthase-like enzyme
MHNKFTLVDGTRLETGSFNYSHQASTANQENQLYLGTPEIVARYKARFEKM